MKKGSQIRIDATKVRGIGDYPGFVHLGHRHLQKEKSEGQVGDGTGVREYVVPLDLARMTVSPALLDGVEEIRLGYKKQG